MEAKTFKVDVTVEISVSDQIVYDITPAERAQTTALSLVDEGLDSIAFETVGCDTYVWATHSCGEPVQCTIRATGSRLVPGPSVARPVSEVES